MKSIDSVRQRVAIVTNRPVRLGFIINRQVDAQALSRVFQYNNLVWGGDLNLFVPTDGNDLNNDWWRILEGHDPDIIIYVGQIDPTLQQRLYEWILPFYHAAWDDKLLKEIGRGQDMHTISIWPLFREQFNRRGTIPSDTSNCRLPVIGKSKYKQFFEMALGKYPIEDKSDTASVNRAFREIQGAKEVVCKPKTLLEYLALQDDLDGKITPLRFTRQLTQVISNGLMFHNPTLVITNGLIDDLFLYHALHWESALVPIVFVHIDDLRSEQNIRLISEWIGPKIHGTRLTLASFSVGIKKLRVLREQIRPFLPERRGVFQEPGWYISVNVGNFQLAMPSAVNQRKQQMILLEGQQVPFIPDIDFQEVLDPISAWVTEVDLVPSYPDKDGFRSSMFPMLNMILSGATRESQWFDPRWQRMTRGILGKLVRQSGTVNSVFLPPSETLIEEIIRQTGKIPARSNLGRYCHGIVDTMDGIENLSFVKEDYIRRLFFELSDERYYRDDKGARNLKRPKAQTWKQMLQIAKPPKASQAKFHKQFEELAGKRVFLRGLNLKCTNCALEAWYEVETLAESITCKGCNRTFQMPVANVDFAYRFNPLFFEGFSQGVSCVLLTILLLHRIASNSLMWQAGYVVPRNKKETEAEYDLIALCDGVLIVAECKAFFKDNEALTQLERDIDFAEKINADVFLFATQKEEVSKRVRKFLQRQDKLRKRLHVRLVTAAELYEGELVRQRESGDQGKEGADSLFEHLKHFPLYEKGLSENDPKGIGGTMAF